MSTSESESARGGTYSRELPADIVSIIPTILGLTGRGSDHLLGAAAVVAAAVAAVAAAVAAAA